MRLTINDIEKKTFARTLFGYRPSEVDNFLVEIVDTIQQLLQELTQNREEIKALQGELNRYQEKEQLLKDSVILATKSHDDIIANAQRTAEDIIKQAQLKVVELHQELARLEAEREHFEFEFYGLLRGFLERLLQRSPALRASEASSAPSSPSRHPPQVLSPAEDSPATNASAQSIFPAEELS